MRAFYGFSFGPNSAADRRIPVTGFAPARLFGGGGMGVQCFLSFQNPPVCFLFFCSMCLLGDGDGHYPPAHGPFPTKLHGFGWRSTKGKGRVIRFLPFIPFLPFPSSKNYNQYLTICPRLTPVKESRRRLHGNHFFQFVLFPTRI